MAASPPSKPELVALRDALLHQLDELERPFRSAALGVARLQRFKLGWLGWLVALPRLTADAFSTADRAWREALIGLVLNDRRTDDRLLAAARDSYAVLARLQRERGERTVAQSWPRMVRLTKAEKPPIAEAGQRCQEAWIRWLDQQAATRPS